MKLRSSTKQVRFDPVIHAVYIRGGVTTRQVTQLQEQAKPRREPHRESYSPLIESLGVSDATSASASAVRGSLAGAEGCAGDGAVAGEEMGG